MKLKNTITAAGLLPLAALSLEAQDRPNFVFFMAEDLAKESFALYNGHAARTPNLEKLAAHGITYNNAYSCAPVSSAARSSLITFRRVSISFLIISAREATIPPTASRPTTTVRWRRGPGRQ